MKQIPVADNWDKEVSIMFAAYKIYIFVKISDDKDDGDYFVIFQSAVENVQQNETLRKQFLCGKMLFVLCFY